MERGSKLSSFKLLSSYKGKMQRRNGETQLTRVINTNFSEKRHTSITASSTPAPRRRQLPVVSPPRTS